MASKSSRKKKCIEIIPENAEFEQDLRILGDELQSEETGEAFEIEQPDQEEISRKRKGKSVSLETQHSQLEDNASQDYKYNDDDVTVKLLVTMSEENLLMAKQEGLLKKSNLTTTISTSDMYFSDDPEEIVEDFFDVMLKELYKKRMQKFLLEDLELDLLKLDNKVRFIREIVEGKIRVGNRKNKADLIHELKEKGFTPFPKKTKVKQVIAGATDAVDEEDSEVIAGATDAVDEEDSEGAGDYDYILQMPIRTLTLEGTQKLRKERDQLNGEVDELRKATPMSFWNKDLDALVAELEGWRMNGSCHKPSRQAPKNPRKNNKNVISVAEPMDTSAASAMETDTVHEVAKGKARAKKVPIKKHGKSTFTLRDEKDFFFDFDNWIAANLECPDQSEVMEVEVPQKQAKKKPPNRKKGIAENKDENNEDIEVQGEDNSDDEDFEVEVAGKKKGGRKSAAGKAKAAKPPAATKKRGPAASSKQSQIVGQSQKPITDVLNPIENDGISPDEKKVRKMRASLFKMGKAAAKDPKDDSEMMTRVTRPQRVNRTKATYV